MAATEETDASTPTPESTGDWPPFVAQWILPYVRETALWPVLVALLGHVWVAIGGLMIALFRDGQTEALKWLVLAALITGAPLIIELRAIRRPGAVTAVVIGSWVISLGLAWIAHTTGVY